MDDEKLKEAEKNTDIIEQKKPDEKPEKKKSDKTGGVKNKLSGISTKKKVIIIIVVIAVILVIGKIITGRTTGAQVEKNTYTEDVAIRTSIVDSLSASGTLEPADKYVVSTLVKGDVLEDFFEYGDTVEKDQILYKLDSDDAQTAIERAELAAKSVNRNYDTVVKNYEKLNVKSNINGVVTDILVKEGDTVSPGQEVAKVRDSSVVTMELPFPADESAAFYIGQPAEVTLYGSFETLPGRVTAVSGATDVVTGNKVIRKVEISVDNPGAIAEGQIATAEVGTSGSTESGKLNFRENKSIMAEVGGDVVAIVADEGAEVAKDGVIIRLESQELADAVESAADSVKDSNLSLENQYDTLEDYTIKSPIKGTVIEKNVKAGDTVGSDNSKLCTIYDLSYLKMTMNIDELDIKKIAIGQEVTITADAVEGKSFTGIVTKINLAGTTTNGVTKYPIEVQIDNPDNELLPGMNVSAEIIVQQVDDVVAIPVGAVISGDMVLVKTGNKSDDPTAPEGYEYVSVETGISDSSYVEIKSGLNEGDEIAYIFSSSGTGDMYGGGFSMGW